MACLNGENPRLRLDPQKSEAFLQQLRAHLQTRAVCAVTVDLQGVERITPAILQVLRTAGAAAQHADKDLYVDGAEPSIYKALHLAQLAPLFKRLHHAATIG